MSEQSTPLEEAMDTLVDHVVKSHEQLTIDYDREWSSPCELGNAFHNPQGQEIIQWRPTRRHASAEDFVGLEHALELTVHEDIKTHYQRYWSANIDAKAPDGHVSLLYLWNQADSDRLIENLIGHSMLCKQNKVPFSIFFACTEPESDLFLTINNETGQVQLEPPGKPPIRCVADSLAEFLQELVPE